MMPILAADGPVRLLPSGDQCLVVVFGESVDEAVNRRVCRFAHRLEAAALPGVVDVVPSFTGVGVHYRADLVPLQAGETPFEALRARIAALVAQPPPAGLDEGRLVEIPVCYGGEYGPDFDEVARTAGVDGDGLVALHTGVESRVFMIGFAPGSPYLGLWDERLAIPRRRTPRTRVPAGSVAIANRQSVIYAYDSPGGWNLIGRTPTRVFDAGRTSPYLLRAGDRVRFVPITPRQYERERRAVR